MDLFSTLSPSRLTPYLNWSGQISSEAMSLYSLNVRISESFYPVLHILEISLRNAINIKMKQKYNEEWLTDESIIKSRFQRYMIKNIIKSNKILKNEKIINDMFVSKLYFSFWTSFFYHKDNNEYWYILRSIFNDNENFYQKFMKFDLSIQKKEVSKQLGMLLRLRNRIAHHKTIIQFDLELLYENCRELIGLISLESLDWCDKFSRFYSVHPRMRIIVDDSMNSKLVSNNSENAILM